ncbi:MAG: hypothetical protein ACJ8C4_01820 [Gemmataceae bacterium]
MPLKANIGATRKLTDNNYGSRGASVNFEIELDTALLQDSAKLQEKIRHVFGLVRTALEQELNGNAPSDGAASSSRNGDRPAATPAYSNGHSAQETRPRPATSAQIKALRAIARSNNVDIGEYLHRTFRVSRPDALSIKQASVAIDELKSANAVAGVGR